jgi:hypothetical protein
MVRGSLIEAAIAGGYLERGRALVRVLCAAVPGLLASAGLPAAASDIRTEYLSFDAGRAVTEASITGYETVDYIVGARQGQSLKVSMATNNAASYFNILAPGETEVAFFNGSIDGNQYEGVAPESGDHRVRVYMMRSAARRDEIASYRLEVILGDGGDVPPGGPAGDALVPGTPYHATGQISCAMAPGQPMTLCSFGVTRQGGGTAVVTVTRSDGRARVIFFVQGAPVGSDLSAADPGDFSATREADVNVIRIGAERYKIPDGVTFGS